MPAQTAASARRLFVALWPDRDVRVALARARDRWNWAPAARPTPLGNLHVTLVFLGDVAPGGVPDLIDALPVLFEPFVLRLDRHALWGNGSAALEPDSACTALESLQAAIAERTVALGFAPEAWRYRPHVTMAHDARGSSGPSSLPSSIPSSVPPGDDGVTWPIGEYALIESRGGRYTNVATWRL